MQGQQACAGAAQTARNADGPAGQKTGNTAVSPLQDCCCDQTDNSPLDNGIDDAGGKSPITPVIPLPLHPASQPATAPASQPTTAPATQAATEPTSQPVVPPIADEPAPTDTATIQSDAALAERLAGVAELEFTTKVDQKEPGTGSGNTRLHC